MNDKNHIKENVLTERSRILYKEMLQEIDECRDKRMPFPNEIECCFQVCNRYWAIVRLDAWQHEFTDEKNEIDFFKNIKPLFTSMMEYYALVTHAALFPRHEKAALMIFLNRELRRSEKFRNENSDFWNYYKGEHTDKDRDYFLRSANDNIFYAVERNYADLEKMTSTPGDQLLATIMALEMYKEFIEKELETLK